MDPVEALLARTEERRASANAALGHAPARVRLGQFYTPSRAAALIAGIPRLRRSGTLRVLDPGAGTGSLTAALIARLVRESPGLQIEIVAAEIDPTAAAHLGETLADCAAVAEAEGTHVTSTVLHADLVDEATRLCGDRGLLAEPFDLVIMNPPYRKLAARSAERQALLAVEGVDCPNLYAAFLAIGVQVLKPGGQLVAITPRSFANGPYFGAFRRFFLHHMALDQIHVFESRSVVFADSDVLQENIVFCATKSGDREQVNLSVSRGHVDEASSRTVAYADIVKPGDPHQFIHIPAGEADAGTAGMFAAMPGGLSELGIQVSTGRVVDFRAREYLLDEPAAGAVPLIYPGNLRDGRVRWPLPIRKPQALVACPDTQKLLLPNERYVVVKRFSAKEERRRVVAVVYDPDDVNADAVGFENHLNVFHCRGRGLQAPIATGLCLWLNSTAVDQFFRIFSGHTQVNATDLRSMRYPSTDQLSSLGTALGQGAWPDQQKIDSLVAAHVFPPADQP
ncbi:MAG TPA: Eco57I restriction-modification methylase domain-containing protein [Streptosporangiaceae bacterium]|nr:Eco57I restriction-modification methylase domain-containing protein [Streptosporangiaceae bacterium]